MISLPNPFSKMTLSQAQFEKLTEHFAEYVVDGMDTNTLVQFAIDSIVTNLSTCSEEELLEEIKQVYDEDVLNELLESVEDVKW